MDRIAAAFKRNGVASGDAVAICARTSINHASAFCGILSASAVRRISPDRDRSRTKVFGCENRLYLEPSFDAHRSLA
jgi:acyl-CoA synthetase (AMP-forming)/AMP-acid ligase II